MGQIRLYGPISERVPGTVIRGSRVPCFIGSGRRNSRIQGGVVLGYPEQGVEDPNVIKDDPEYPESGVPPWLL